MPFWGKKIIFSIFIMKPNLYPIKVFLFRIVAGVMWNIPWLVLEDGGVGPAANILLLT